MTLSATQDVPLAVFVVTDIWFSGRTIFMTSMLEVYANF